MCLKKCSMWNISWLSKMLSPAARVLNEQREVESRRGRNIWMKVSEWWKKFWVQKIVQSGKKKKVGQSSAEVSPQAKVLNKQSFAAGESFEWGLMDDVTWMKIFPTQKKSSGTRVKWVSAELSPRARLLNREREVGVGTGANVLSQTQIRHEGSDLSWLRVGTRCWGVEGRWGIFKATRRQGNSWIKYWK